MSSGNFSLFCNFQNNFRFLSEFTVLLDVDAAANLVPHSGGKTNGVLGFFVFRKRNCHSATFQLNFLLPCTTLCLACTLSSRPEVMHPTAGNMDLVADTNLSDPDDNLVALSFRHYYRLCFSLTHDFSILYLSSLSRGKLKSFLNFLLAR